MSMSDRDKKILLAVVPVVLIVAYWFLLLAPKREEAATAKDERAKQEERLATAEGLASQATGDKTDFAADYGEIVRLGKAIPAKVDMPSLLVQLDAAAEGTDIEFTKISMGERVAATAPAATAGSTPPPGSNGGTPPAAAGGTPAQSAPGGATEAANTAAATANQQSDSASQSGVDTTTSTTAREGGLPIGGGAGGAATGGEAAPASGGLETVPLELEFVGNFFRLADFFHDVKRFVHVVNNDVVVNGRLVTIDSVSFSSDTNIFPRIKASLTATVYLSPLTQGATAGATPAGPADPTTPAAAPAAPADGTAPAPTTPAPTAAATP
jgi:Tfp pilus assembly protein PilO